MDTVDLGLRGDASRPEPVDQATASRPTPDGEGVLWSEFAEASTVEAYSQSWLALQVGQESLCYRGL